MGYIPWDKYIYWPLGNCRNCGHQLWQGKWLATNIDMVPNVIIIVVIILFSNPGKSSSKCNFSAERWFRNQIFSSPLNCMLLSSMNCFKLNTSIFSLTVLPYHRLTFLVNYISWFLSWRILLSPPYSEILKRSSSQICYLKASWQNHCC
jgi:hypothetical protein